MADENKSERISLMKSIFERYDSCIKDLATLGYYNDADIIHELRKNMVGRLLVETGEFSHMA